MTTKQEIFDLFYKLQDTSRSGGGKLKSKMSRCDVPKTSQDVMLLKINSDTKLLTYYNKLLNRSSDLAPPPRPSS